MAFMVRQKPFPSDANTLFCCFSFSSHFLLSFYFSLHAFPLQGRNVRLNATREGDAGEQGVRWNDMLEVVLKTLPFYM
jgi:hypothetical protein